MRSFTATMWISLLLLLLLQVHFCDDNMRARTVFEQYLDIMNYDPFHIGNTIISDYPRFLVLFITINLPCLISLLCLNSSLFFNLTGLVVPVLRNTENMDFAGVEKAISHYGKKVKYSTAPPSVPISSPDSTCHVSLPRKVYLVQAWRISFLFHFSASYSPISPFINLILYQAKDGALALEDMTGGTFTISNGGVFGSLFGTPIINIPQSAILGMHATKVR